MVEIEFKKVTPHVRDGVTGFMLHYTRDDKELKRFVYFENKDGSRVWKTEKGKELNELKLEGAEDFCENYLRGLGTDGEELVNIAYNAINERDEVKRQKGEAEKSAINRGVLAAGMGGLFVLASIAGAAIHGQLEVSKEKAKDLQEKVDFYKNHVDKWNASHEAAGFDTGFNAALAEKTADLVEKVNEINASHPELVKKELQERGANNVTDLGYTALLEMVGDLYFETGKLSSPAAQNATEVVAEILNETYNIPKEDLADLNIFGMLNVYRQIVEKEALANADDWNNTWYEKGIEEAMAEILAKVPAWGWQNYTLGKQHGAQDILNQTDAWNATHYEAGKAWSLEQVLAVVDDILTQAEIDSANGNLTKLIELYGKSIKEDALALTDYNANYVIEQFNQGNLNETEIALGRLASLYGDVNINDINATQSFYENLTEADNEALIANGINVSYLMNRGYAFRAVNTYGDGAVFIAQKDDDMRIAEISQDTYDRFASWEKAYEAGE